MTKRDYCINELVETEKNYIEALAMIINVCRIALYCNKSYFYTLISSYFLLFLYENCRNCSCTRNYNKFVDNIVVLLLGICVRRLGIDASMSLASLTRKTSK